MGTTRRACTVSLSYIGYSGVPPQLNIATLYVLGEEVEMSRQGDAHFSKVILCDVNKLVDAGDAIFIECWDVSIHLDGREPLLHRLAVQGVCGTAVAVLPGLAGLFGSTA